MLLEYIFNISILGSEGFVYAGGVIINGCKKNINILYQST